jgi:hypothetical protein
MEVISFNSSGYMQMRGVIYTHASVYFFVADILSQSDLWFENYKVTLK